MHPAPSSRPIPVPAILLIASAFALSPAEAIPLYDPGPLSFTTSNQSMWGSGEGTAPVTKTYSKSWSDSFTIGGITGGVSTTPGIPYVEDHGYGEWHETHCHSWWCAVDPHVPYWEWHPRTEWHTPTITVDTRTGLKADIGTSGSVGLSSSLGFNGGTIDATVTYAPSLTLPENIRPGEFFSLAPAETLSDGALTGFFPALTGRVSASLAVSIDTSIESCTLGAGCSTSDFNLLDIPTTNLDIFKSNTPDLPPDTASLFGLDGLPFDVTRGTVWADFAVPPGSVILSLPGADRPRLGAGFNLGNLVLDYPGLPTSGGLDGDRLVASGTFDNLVQINADLDAAAVANGLIPALGAVAYAGPLTFRGDLLDIDLGPTIDLSQRLSLYPTLMVDLAFDHPVLLEGDGAITTWSGPWDAIPRLALHDGHEVNVTPTFWVDALLENQTSLDFDLTLSVDVLKGSISLSLLTSPTLSLVNDDYVISLGSVDVFNESFPLGGFRSVTAKPFTLSAYISSNAVPEPGTLLLVVAGLLGLGAGRKRRDHASS